jgi:hypothetical protein
MILLQTVGSVDLPGQGARKLPAPKQYVAIIVLWSILGFVADLNAGAARVASQFSILLVLAGAIVGPFGQRFLGFTSGVAALFPVNTTAAGTTGTQEV